LKHFVQLELVKKKYLVFLIFFPGTFAIISTMVGEVCDREVTKHLPGSMGNLSFNSSTGDNLDSSMTMDDVKLQIAISLTLLVGIIQVSMKAPPVQQIIML
jgi:hypothetical protein